MRAVATLKDTTAVVWPGTGLWDILILNPEHLLDKATTKNDKVDKEKDIGKFGSQFGEISPMWDKNCNRQTEKFF